MKEIYFCPNCMAKIAPGNGKCPECGGDINIENAPHQLPVNSILNGRYLIGRVLGAGGFGITYIGYDLKNNCRVAIKEYYPSGAANRSTASMVLPTSRERGNPFEVGKDRFLKEARTLSGFVEDKNIVTLKDYFEENGTAYIVMEYLDGVDLGRYAKEHGRLELDAVLTMLEPAMLALDKVHKKGLIHRDISPSNLMLLKDGSVKVLDFGSARMQNIEGELSLSVRLKPGFAPEEQYRTHGEQGSWTDVYAMSATIYRLITGKTPPSSTDRAFEDTIELPSKLGVEITPSQEQALMRGLAVRASDRTQTMAELAESLHVKKKVAPKPSDAEEHKKENKPKTSAALKKRLIAVGAAVLVILTLCVIVPTAKRSIEEKQHLEELTAVRKTVALHNETTISAGYRHTVGLKADGTVRSVGMNTDGRRNVSDWTDIVAVSAGTSHTVGLKTDGTVVAAGNNDYGQCDVSGWTDIVAVSAGSFHTVGLKSDGAVVAVGWNQYGQCDVADWTNIVAVSAGNNHTVGLKLDGTVVAVGNNVYTQCDVTGWTDIVAVSAGGFHTVGLKADGTVVAVGSDKYGRCEVSDWTDIVAVSAGDNHTVGMKADGTVLAVGNKDNSKCNISGWTGVVAISAGSLHTVGLKTDGTVVTAGDDDRLNCAVVSNWRDIKLP